MESNRNLSSIIQNIRDDGPPEPASATTARPHEPGPQTGTRSASAGRRIRLLVLWLASCLVLVAAAFWLLQMYGITKQSAWSDLRQQLDGIGSESVTVADAPQRTLPAGSPAATPSATQAVADERIDHLQAQLDALGARLMQATAAQAARARELDRILGNMADSQHQQAQQLAERVETLQHRVDALAKKRKTAAAHPAGTAPAHAQPSAARAVHKPVVTAPAHDTPPDPPAADRPSTEPAVDRPSTEPVVGRHSNEPVADRIAAVAPEQPAQQEWVVNVASSTELARIEQEQQHMHRLGIQVERQHVEYGGEQRYRLRVTGFHSIEDARAYAGKLEKEMGIKGAWASLR